jgi:SAM-dependent methyltransferase
MAMISAKLRLVLEKGLDQLNLKGLNRLVYDSNKFLHAFATRRYARIRGKKCLVIGCNTGRDCGYFVRLGAKEVHGLDIIDEIGKDFPHPRVRYHKASCEKMVGVPGDYYDLVFCYATMEHIPRIDLAFPEMVRVARPGGIIYAFSSPLWYSRYGHHCKNLLKGPWLHLRYNKDEIIHDCTSRGIQDSDGRAVDAVISYVLGNSFLNKVPAKTYINICNDLHGIQIIKNEIFFEEPKVLSPALKSELVRKGYAEEDLLAVSHTFIARKLHGEQWIAKKI